MPRTIAGSAQDLKLLKAGICPDCGATITAGMASCPSCKVSFGAHASAFQPPPQAPPSRPAAPASAPAAHVAPAAAVAARAASSPRGLTAEQIDDLERGMHARALFPHTFAEGPENGSSLALGSALARAAQLVMADAALVDDPQVLSSGKSSPSPIPRVKMNVATSSAAMVDDAPPPWAASLSAPAARTAPPAARAAPAPAPAPARAQPPPPHVVPQYAQAAPVAAAVPPSEEPTTLPEQPAFDPDATLKHDADEVAAQIKAARELIAARGGAQRLE